MATFGALVATDFVAGMHLSAVIGAVAIIACVLACRVLRTREVVIGPGVVERAADRVA